jgi:hypothetical protein
MRKADDLIAPDVEGDFEHGVQADIRGLEKIVVDADAR